MVILSVRKVGSKCGRICITSSSFSCSPCGRRRRRVQRHRRSLPFLGFSGDCPILLMCNTTISSKPLLPNSTQAAPYPIMSFNSTASTFLASLTTSCNRSVRGVAHRHWTSSKARPGPSSSPTPTLPQPSITSLTTGGRLGRRGFRSVD